MESDGLAYESAAHGPAAMEIVGRNIYRVWVCASLFRSRERSKQTPQRPPTVDEQLPWQGLQVESKIARAHDVPTHLKLFKRPLVYTPSWRQSSQLVEEKNKGWGSKA